MTVMIFIVVVGLIKVCEVFVFVFESQQNKRKNPNTFLSILFQTSKCYSHAEVHGRFEKVLTYVAGLNPKLAQVSITERIDILASCIKKSL